MTKNLAESLNNILDLVEYKCTDAGGDIQFNPENLDAFAEETAYIKKRMGLEPFQAILFAVIIVCNASGRCNVNNVWEWVIFRCYPTPRISTLCVTVA